MPKTFENLIWKIIKMLPLRCTTLHVVAGSYREVFIKSRERKKGGITLKVYVKSVLSNVSPGFQVFLKNGDKNRLIELFFVHHCKVLNVRRPAKTLLPKRILCLHVTFSSVTAWNYNMNRNNM